MRWPVFGDQLRKMSAMFPPQGLLSAAPVLGDSIASVQVCMMACSACEKELDLVLKIESATDVGRCMPVSHQLRALSILPLSVPPFLTIPLKAPHTSDISLTCRIDSIVPRDTVPEVRFQDLDKISEFSAKD